MTAYIFDLGGVLVDLNIDGAFREFGQIINPELAKKGMEELTRVVNKNVDEYQRGDISTDEFLTRQVALCQAGVSKEQMLEWWNKPLISLPEHRMERLAELIAAGHQVYLLSNINEAHWEYCKEKFFKGRDMSRYFTRLFLSYEMHMIKPDACIYEEVIRQTGINPAETKYFDDLPENIAAGKAAGLQAIQVVGDEWKLKIEN